MQTPLGASRDANPFPMGGRVPEAEETRFIVTGSNPKEKLVILINEIWQTDTGELGNILPSFFKSFEQNPEVDFRVHSTKANNLTLFAAAPSKVAIKDGKAVALAGMTMTPDGTLQYFGFYINDELAKRPSGCTALAQKLLATVTKASRELERSAGKRELSTPLLNTRLALQLPAEFVVASQIGPDFSIHRVRKLAALGEYPGELRIYVGPSPKLDTKLPSGLSTKHKKSLPGRLLGGFVRYSGWSTDTSALLAATAPLSKKPTLLVQVELDAQRDSAFTKELKAIAQTIKVVKGK